MSTHMSYLPSVLAARTRLYISSRNTPDAKFWRTQFHLKAMCVASALRRRDLLKFAFCLRAYSQCAFDYTTTTGESKK